MKFRAFCFAMTAVTALSGASCSSEASDHGNALTGAVGGPVAGAEDDHCAGQPVGVADPAACLGSGAEEAAGDEDADDGSAGATDCNLAHDDDYGETLYNGAGDDDDCKYRVSLASTPIRKGKDVTFTVTATSKSDGAPLEKISAQRAGAVALSRIEPYIPCEPTHFPPLADLSAPITETAPGIFSVGPVVFDESGRWVLRLHFYEECVDAETSPHGHAAFFIDVP